MRFEQGKSGNPNGRPKGAKNKIQAEVKKLLEEIFRENRTDIKEAFKNLKGASKVRATTELLPYILPKLTNNSVEFEHLTDAQLDEIIQELKNPNT